MSVELTIYGAAYGPKDVTAKVRSLRKGQKLSITVSNDTFGEDPWQGNDKTLVVVYKYTAHSVITKIVAEGHQCIINLPSQPSAPVAKDRLDSFQLEAIQQVTSRQMKDSAQPLVILGAAYGMQKVTQKANSLLSANGKFDQCASNEVWGDGWKGHEKTLVVVYEYAGLQMLDVVKENERMHLIASPPMTILGAAYGLTDVTTKTHALVKNRSLVVAANNNTFGDGWHGVDKTLVVTYQYGEQIPIVKTVKEKGTLKIIYDKTDVFTGSTNPDDLTILGAAYGPSDVTQRTQSLVKKDGTLQTEADNDVFGPDPWSGVNKSLVVVYRYGRNPPLMKIVPEGSKMSIAKVVFPYVGLVDTNDLLNDGDILALGAINGKYISCNSNNKLVAEEDVPNDGCTMTVTKDGQSNFFKIQCNNKKYVTVAVDAHSSLAPYALYATSSKEEATKFSISISVNGGLRLTTAGGIQMYVRFDSSDSSLRTTSIDQFGACTIFDIAFKRTGDGLSKYTLDAESLSECDIAWGSFIWILTGGFFLAVGLGPFISTGRVHTGVTGLIQTNPTAGQAIQNLQQAITNGLGNTGALVSSMLGVIGIFYHEGLLWTIFKEMLKLGGWYAVTWALAKIIEIMFLPQAEAAELLASFTIWGVQTVEAGLAVGQACN